MNVTKKEAITYLSEYRELQFHEKNIEEQMFSIACLLRDLEIGEEKGNGKAARRLKAAWEKLTLDLGELRLRHARVSFRRKQIDALVGALPEKERRILERYYLHGEPARAAEDLMEQLGYEKSQIYRLRDQALAVVCRRLSERVPLSGLEASDK